MAVSRRLRFEILRRDDYSCRYCGAKAPDVVLTVDHVIPVALGGADEPANLVAACEQCNAGKSSIAPDAEIVEDVAQDAIRWAKAIAHANQLRAMDRQLLREQLAWFEKRWNRWTYGVEVHPDPIPPEPTGWDLFDNWLKVGGLDTRRFSRPISYVDGVLTVAVQSGCRGGVRQELNWRDSRTLITHLLGESPARLVFVDGHEGPVPGPEQPSPIIERHNIPLPREWESSVERFITAGLPLEEMDRLIEVAMKKSGVARPEVFRYFAGCCWREITDIQETARRLLESEGSASGEE